MGESSVNSNNNTLLTFSNIKYLVEGLDALLHTNLDGDKRAKVIKLRDDLTEYINNFFNEYSLIQKFYLPFSFQLSFFDGIDNLIIGISGTPGVGKHTIVSELVKLIKRCTVIDINKIILSNNFLVHSTSFFTSPHASPSFAHDDLEIDIRKTFKFLKEEISKNKSDYQDVIIVGHLLPYVIDPLQVDIVIVLRRSPHELKKVYESRSYSQEKINDNLISEIIGTLFYDSLKKFGEAKISEAEISNTIPTHTHAKKVLEMCLNKEFRKFGRIDWLPSTINDPEMVKLLK